MKNVEYGIMWAMNQLLTPGIALVLSESLSLYWRILKAKWPSLLIVAAFSQLILTAIRLALQRCCEIGGMDALPTDVLASILVFQTSGLVALVIAVDYAARLLSGGRSPESGGIAAAYGRALATSLCWMVILSASGIAVYYAKTAANPATVLALKAIGLDATVNTTIHYFAAIVPVGLLTAAFLLFAWLLTCWLFSVPLSIIRPLAGPTAMSASLKLVKGNFCRNLMFATGAYFVPVGITVVPALLVAFFAGDMLPGSPFLKSAAVRESVVFCAGLVLSLAFPLSYVASLAYIRHNEGNGAQQRESSEGRSRQTLLSVLFVIAISLFSFGVSEVRNAARRIREGATFASFFADDVEVVHDISPECRFVETLREENGEFFVDSPFDLLIGSARYADQIGERRVRLSKPYHGFKYVSLAYSKSDRKLTGMRVTKGGFLDESAQMPMAECRAEVAAIAADICARMGIPPDAMKITDEFDEDVFAFVKRAKEQYRGLVSRSFCCRRALLRIDGQIVSYNVYGSLHAQTERCSVEIFIRREQPRASM